MQPRPPRGVAVLTLAALLGGLVLILEGIVTIDVASFLSLTDLAGSPFSSLALSTIQNLLTTMGALSIVIGIFYLALTTGYWGLKNWAWKLGIIVTTVSLIVDITQIVIGIGVIVVASIFGTIIAAIILYFLAVGRSFFVTAKGKPPKTDSPMMASAWPARQER
jgi:uncharacterized membrane protein (DUF2068 family)